MIVEDMTMDDNVECNACISYFNIFMLYTKTIKDMGNEERITMY